MVLQLQQLYLNDHAALATAVTEKGIHNNNNSIGADGCVTRITCSNYWHMQQQQLKQQRIIAASCRSDNELVTAHIVIGNIRRRNRTQQNRLGEKRTQEENNIKENRTEEKTEQS
jgi:hypothetical protein